MNKVFNSGIVKAIYIPRSSNETMEKQDCDRYNNPFISHLVQINFDELYDLGKGTKKFIPHIVQIKLRSGNGEPKQIFIPHLVQIKPIAEFQRLTGARVFISHIVQIKPL